MWYVIREDELYHHGIKGQKWGVRRFQNPDGTLTAAGRKRLYKAAKSPWASEERSDAIRGSLSSAHTKRLSDATKRMYKADKEAEKAEDRFYTEHANRVKEKLGPSYNVKTDVKKAEKVWNEELFKDTPSRKAMLEASNRAKAERKALDKIGEDIAKELLGKYSDKPARSFIYGTERAYIAMGRMVVAEAMRS